MENSSIAKKALFHKAFHPLYFCIATQQVLHKPQCTYNVSSRQRNTIIFHFTDGELIQGHNFLADKGWTRKEQILYRFLLQDLPENCSGEQPEEMAKNSQLLTVSLAKLSQDINEKLAPALGRIRICPLLLFFQTFLNGLNSFILPDTYYFTPEGVRIFLSTEENNTKKDYINKVLLTFPLPFPAALSMEVCSPLTYTVTFIVSAQIIFLLLAQILNSSLVLLYSVIQSPCLQIKIFYFSEVFLSTR